jgi:cellulose synthase/poly-beta-1,6-N-acetylglucosamine synthase-like glycosyltransferase
MPPRVTVILLTCNRTSFVRQALDGLLKQRFIDWTLTASDCSTEPALRDEIRSVIEDYRRKDPAHEIRFIQQPERIVQSEHLKRALVGIQTPYVALLDDDDIWMPDHLERACQWLDQSPRHGLAISNGRIIDAEGIEQGWTNSREDPLPESSNLHGWLRLFMTSFFGSTSGYVFRYEAIAHHTFFPTSLVDVHLALSILLNHFQLVCFPEASYFYRVHGGSSYTKGAQVVQDRHDLRLWLFQQQGLRIVRKFPLFLFMVAKSAGSRAIAIFQDATRKAS